jgi:hypothetical protein
LHCEYVINVSKYAEAISNKEVSKEVIKESGDE